MALQVKFWGTRGSIPTPGWQTRTYGGNTPCVSLRTDATLIVCDAGTGLRELGQHLMTRHRGPVVAHLFFSHPHWDHIQGFPFFVPAYVPNNKLYIYGQKAYELLSGQMQSDYFPVAFSSLGAEIAPCPLAEGLHIDGIKVSWLEQRHPGGSLGYKFEQGDVKVVYATDNELDLAIPESSGAAADPAALRAIERSYLDFIRGAQLLIADGQYTDDEYPKKVRWGHARATTVVDAAVRAGVKRLAIFHHDPLHNDDAINDLITACTARARQHHSNLVVFAAREGVELRVR